MAFVMNSPAFADGHEIPRKYTRDGDNVPPPLEWRGAPPGTKSYALVVEDPDAPTGTFRHWGVYNIMAGRNRLPEGAGVGARTESLGHGVNDFGHAHYDGPEPPEGHGVHHYHFRLAALDVETLDLPPTAAVEDVWAAAREHVIAEAELVGTYVRGERPRAAAETVSHRRPAACGPAGATSGPVRRAGDAGGPGEGRNLTSADISGDRGKPPPNRLGDAATDQPSGARPARGLGTVSDTGYDPTIAGPAAGSGRARRSDVD